MEQIVIWGTGDLAMLAVQYYQHRAELAGFIDMNKSKQGKKIAGVEIHEPAFLKDADYKVVIAVQYGAELAEQLLVNELHVYKYTKFAINEEYIEAKKEDATVNVDKNSIIINYMGGLGNQMCIYALQKNFEKRGRHVYADKSFFENIRKEHEKFVLPQVFRNIKLIYTSEKEKKELTNKAMLSNGCGEEQSFLIHTEPTMTATTYVESDMNVLSATSGIIWGFFQDYRVANAVRDELLNDFQFPHVLEEKLAGLKEQISRENAVSIHVRRGDYLAGSNVFMYGNICTADYYRGAVDYIREKQDNCSFYVFSNDMEWARDNLQILDAHYLDESCFDTYSDWYDLLLMSCCKHNIIANSTFSWWGAWLNQNDNKIVVAPSRVKNNCIHRYFYLPEWIRIDENGELLKVK